MSHFLCDLKKADLSLVQTQRWSIVYKLSHSQCFTFVIGTIWNGLQWSDDRKFYGVTVFIPNSVLTDILNVSTTSIEYCKIALDWGKRVGLLWLDLSKAFDCLPHRLFLCNLHAYGIPQERVNSYFLIYEIASKEVSLPLLKVIGPIW